MNNLLKALIATLGIGSIAQAAPNLIPFNSDFELGSPAGWYMWLDEKGGGNASFETQDAVAHTGRYALKFQVRKASMQEWQVQLTAPAWEVKPNSRYRLSFWIKGPGPVRVSTTDAAKNWAWMGGFLGSANNTGWSQVTGEFTTTTQQGKGKVGVAVCMGATAGDYFLDDFQLEEIENTTP